MTAHESTLLSFVGRLEKLERENRRMKRAAGALVILALAILLIGGQAQPKGRTIEAEKFVLLDQNGKKRALLGVDKPGAPQPGLLLYDEDEKPRALLSASKEKGSFLCFFEEKFEKQKQVLLGMDKEGKEFLGFNDKNGKTRVFIFMDQAGLGMVTLQSEDQKGRIGLAMTRDDKVFLVLKDKNDKTRAMILVDKDGRPAFALQDANEKAFFGRTQP